MAIDFLVSGPADQSIVASVLYRPGQAPKTIPLSEASTAVGQDHGLLWIGLKEPEPALQPGPRPAERPQLGLRNLGGR